MHLEREEDIVPKDRYLYEYSRNCLDCGKKITRRATRCNSCSQTGKLNYGWKDGYTLKKGKCLDCGRTLKHWRSKRCKSCNNKYHFSSGIFNNKGKRNGRWEGGIAFGDYGQAFNKATKEQIRFRDKYTCQMCGCSQLENGRELSCHHIDYNKKNNKLNNLISLCVNCHSKTNNHRKYWMDKLNANIVSVKQD